MSSIDKNGLLYLLNKIKGVINSISTKGSTNIGEIFYWPKTTPPDGSLYCDGRAISREVYKDLFNVIGTNFGSGNGSTTFNLPDLRGEFIRGYDPTNIRDPLGSTRGIGKHQNATKIPAIRIDGTNNISRGSTNVTVSDADITESSSSYGWFNPTGSTSSSSIHAFRPRPTNVNLLPCIRYK